MSNNMVRSIENPQSSIFKYLYTEFNHLEKESTEVHILQKKVIKLETLTEKMIMCLDERHK